MPRNQTSGNDTRDDGILGQAARSMTQRAALGRHARRALDAGRPAVTDWIKGGAALAATRTGAKLALTVAKRNPAVFVAAGVLGAGVLAYRFYRKRNPKPDPAASTTPLSASEPTPRRRRTIEGTGEVVARRHHAARARTATPDATAQATAGPRTGQAAQRSTERGQQDAQPEA